MQFLNPTFLVGPIIQVARLGRFDLIHEVQSTWNRWAMDVVDGHADRLIPVTQIDLHDIDWSLGEMERMREAGSRAFMIPEAPVGGRGRAADGSRAVGRSISHPDFDPIWSAAEDLGMAAFAHVGFGRERINAGWANNGADDLLTFNALNMLVGSRSRRSSSSDPWSWTGCSSGIPVSWSSWRRSASTGFHTWSPPWK